MPKKLRLPRKVKKAMLTAQRKFDKNLGFKCRRKVMIRYMHMQYLKKIYKIKDFYEPEEMEINVDKIIAIPKF